MVAYWGWLFENVMCVLIDEGIFPVLENRLNYKKMSMNFAFGVENIIKLSKIPLNFRKWLKLSLPLVLKGNCWSFVSKTPLNYWKYLKIPLNLKKLKIKLSQLVYELKPLTSTYKNNTKLKIFLLLV